MRERLKQAVEQLRAWRDGELSRCAKACFMGGDGEGLTLEGERLLADLRKQSRLFHSGVTRDAQGRIDRDELLRIEGRREIVLRLINLLELGPMQAGRLVEVDDGRT